MVRFFCLGLLFIFSLGAEAQAQNYDEVLEKCRASVGYPIVHPCMVSKRGQPGDRESKLAECRVLSGPVVSRCVRDNMMKGVVAHGEPAQERRVNAARSPSQSAIKPAVSAPAAPQRTPAANSPPQQTVTSQPPRRRNRPQRRRKHLRLFRLRSRNRPSRRHRRPSPNKPQRRSRP
jgi:hypothetical protein